MWEEHKERELQNISTPFGLLIRNTPWPNIRVKFQIFKLKAAVPPGQKEEL